ncbi:hypothetical protein [Labilibaculum sp.]|uniref:hypothetical protein n=1 Tax=Labilibaculum sp. TaxID=2060723 RepID=UPI00356567C4
MNLRKKTYLAIAAGILFLFMAFSVTFVIIGINKEGPLLDNFAIRFNLAYSLLILLLGFVFSLCQALKKEAS